MIVGGVGWLVGGVRMVVESVCGRLASSESRGR